MPRVVVLLLVIVGTCVLAACGGSSADAPAGESSDPTLAGLIGTPAATQLVTPNLIVMGGTDFPAGKTVRIPFQIYRKDGQLLEPDGGKGLRRSRLGLSCPRIATAWHKMQTRRSHVLFVGAVGRVG